MITLRFNPKAITNEGQAVKKVAFIPQHSVIFYVQMGDFKYKEVGYIRNGKRAHHDDIVKDGDEIIIVPEIRFWVVAIFGVKLMLITWVTMALTVLSVIYSVVSAFMAGARKPSTGSGADTSSPTYGWDGIQNTAQVGLPVPIVYGTHRVGGQVIGEYVNTLDDSDNYLNILFAVSEGVIDGISSVEVNGNPISNFNLVTTNTRLGTNTQTPIPNFQQVHQLRSVNVQLAYNVPQVYTCFSAIDSFEVHLLMQNGLFAQDQNTGAIISWSVSFLVEYKLHSSGTWISLGTTTLTDTTRTAKRFKVRGDAATLVTNGIYDIRITKQTSDSDFFHTVDLTWDTVDEITNQDLAYPNTALLSVTALATRQLSGSTPTFTSIVRGINVKVPNVLNGSTPVVWDNYYYDPTSGHYKLLANDTVLSWDGTTYVTAYSANPIWCLMDLLTNTRYGLGQFITSSMIDMTSFLAMSQYCEQKVSNGAGGYEKRLQLNMVLDAATNALDLLMQVCATFRGLLIYSCGTIKVKIDQPGIPVQLFTMGNIINGKFQQTWMSLRDRYNVFEIQYLDATMDYQLQVLAVIDEAALAGGAPMRTKQIRMYCTNASQAYREGRFLLWMNKFITRVLTLKVDIDAICCEAGDIISVSHDVSAWGIGSGRVQAGSTTTVVNLDHAITLESGVTYGLLIRHAMDDSIEEAIISNPPGTYTSVTLSAPLLKTAKGSSFLPSGKILLEGGGDILLEDGSGKLFLENVNIADVYSIGQLSLESKPFRVVNIKYNGDFTADIQAIEYNPSVYDDTPPTIAPNPSALSFQVPNVQDLKLTTGLIKASDGTIQNTIDVWFQPPDPTGVYVMYESADIYLSDNGGANWAYKGNTSGGSFRISDGLLVGTTYTIAVCSVDAKGNIVSRANSPQATITLAAKTTPPSNVPTFLVNQSRDRLTFGWTGITDLDLSGYEIRYGSAWATGTVLATGIKSTTYISLFVNLGTNNFWICAIDSSGNYSAIPTEAIVTIAAIPYQNIINSYAEESSFSGTKVNLTVSGSNLVHSGSNLSGTYTTPVRDLGFVATFGITITPVVSNANTSAKMSDSLTAKMNDDLTLRMSGQDAPTNATFQIKTSNDNITWRAWAPWQNGDYTCRYFQIQMTLVRANTGQTIQCSALDYQANLPSVIDSGTNTVTVAASGIATTFVKTFHQTPVVNITILSGSGIYAVASAISTTGFTTTLYNAAGVAQTGQFSWAANGV